PDRRQHGIEILPNRITRIDAFLPLAAGNYSSHLARQIHTGSLSHSEASDPIVDHVYAHLQTQAVKISVARVHDCEVYVRCSVILAAMNESVANCNAAATNNFRVFEGDYPFFQRRGGHHDLPR